MENPVFDDKKFKEWESETFGYGYGTGERPVLAALKMFMDLTKTSPMGSVSYDYMELEKHMPPATTWLLINVLCRASIIDYGTSPRYAWLTPLGKALKTYLDTKNGDELYAIVTAFDEAQDY